VSGPQGQFVPEPVCGVQCSSNRSAGTSLSNAVSWLSIAPQAIAGLEGKYDGFYSGAILYIHVPKQR
jgi:hypothetical protein